MDQPQLTERFNKLEAQVAHLEYAYDQLNEVVLTQQKLLARLRGEMHRLGHSLESMEVDRIQSNPQKPPHYQ